jgi:hypothetical protein
MFIFTPSIAVCQSKTTRCCVLLDERPIYCDTETYQREVLRVNQRETGRRLGQGLDQNNPKVEGCVEQIDSKGNPPYQAIVSSHCLRLALLITKSTTH